MQGWCLCGMTHYRVEVAHIRAYQCHCSLCRMQSGTASNLGAIVQAERFAWLSDTDHIRYWTKASGFTSGFCSNCGSPVPNKLRGLEYYWVPVGCLDGDASVEIVAHLCAASRAGWDDLTDGPARHEGVPELAELIHELVSS